MATLGQKISEFIVRAEAFIKKNVPEILEELDDGYDDAWERITFTYDLLLFLIELQGLYQDWSERHTLTMIDYFDSTYNLKALQSTIPDPYRSYENLPTVLTQTTLLEVPNGNGLLQQINGEIVLYPNETKIESYYGLV